MNRRTLLLTVSASIPCALAQAPPASTPAPDLAGAYRAIASDTRLPGGLKKQGSPAALALQPSAAQEMKSVDLKQDPAKMCAPIGPFRMVAWEQNKIELVPAQLTLGN